MGLIDWIKSFRSRKQRQPGVRIVSQGQDPLTDVPESRAMQMSVVWRCVQFLASSLSTVPMKMHRYETPDDRREGIWRPDRSHRFHYTLTRKANPWMPARVFWWQMYYRLFSRGNAYAAIMDDGNGGIELWPLVGRAKIDRWPGNSSELRYKFFITGLLNNDTELVLPGSRVLHLRLQTTDGVHGISPIRQAAISLGVAIEQERYAANFFASGGRPKQVIEHPLYLDEESRQKWRKILAEAQHGLAVLDEGAKYRRIGVIPEEAQFIQSRKFSIPEICRYFSVYPHQVMHFEGQNYNTVEQLSIHDVRYSLRPPAVIIEDIVRETASTPLDGNNAIIDDDEKPIIQLDALLRGDMKSRYEAYESARNWGLKSANDVRQLEDEPPIPAEKGGDEYVIPVNMMNMGQLVRGPGPANRSEVRTAARAEAISVGVLERFQNRGRILYERPLRMQLERERDTVLEVIEGMELDPAQIFTMLARNWTPEMRRELRNDYDSAASAHSDMIFEALEEERNAEARQVLNFEEALRSNVATLARVWSDDSMRAVADMAVDYEDFAEYSDAVQEQYNQWNGERVAVYAKRSSTQVTNAAAMNILARRGVTRKKWIKTSPADCPICTELNGKVVGISEPFWNAQDEIGKTNYRPSSYKFSALHPPIHDECACLIVEA